MSKATRAMRRLTGAVTVSLLITTRDDCPCRVHPSNEEGWGPRAPWCDHPKRKERGGDAWCPDEKNQRDDDPSPATTPFPPKCPLLVGETLSLGS